VDYQSNSKKAKEPKEEPAKKEIQKVVVGEVVVKKKPFGQRIKDTFVAADFSSVARYVVTEVLIPAARNMIVDASTKGIERMMYGERHGRPRYSAGSRSVYQSSPLRTDYRHPATRPPSQLGHRARLGRNDFILETREEASEVLEKMNDILEMYEMVSIGDLHELLGLPTSHVDQKWGWTTLTNVSIRQIREGFLLELPPEEPI
jgi:hypothetical protein